MMVYSPDLIKKRMLEYTHLDNQPVSQGMRGVITGFIEASLKLSDILPNEMLPPAKRQVLLGWLFLDTVAEPGTILEPLSSKKLSGAAWSGLMNWVSPFRESTTGEWLHRRQLKTEACWIFQRAWYYFSLTQRMPLPLAELERLYAITQGVGLKMEMPDDGLVADAINNLGGVPEHFPLEIIRQTQTPYELGYIPL